MRGEHDFDKIAGICRRCGQHVSKVGGQPCVPLNPSSPTCKDNLMLRVRPWQPHEDELLRQANAQGVYLTTLARRLRRTKNDVLNRRRRLGLKRTTGIERATLHCALPLPIYDAFAREAFRRGLSHVSLLTILIEEHLNVPQNPTDRPPHLGSAGGPRSDDLPSEPAGRPLPTPEKPR